MFIFTCKFCKATFNFTKGQQMGGYMKEIVQGKIDTEKLNTVEKMRAFASRQEKMTKDKIKEFEKRCVSAVIKAAVTVLD